MHHPLASRLQSSLDRQKLTTVAELVLGCALGNTLPTGHFGVDLVS
jgi:hypothetical protein